MANLSLNGAVFAHEAVVKALIDHLASKGLINAQEWAAVLSAAKGKAQGSDSAAEVVKAITAMYG